ncbi:uncharacterized protein LOC106078800 isoform X1 [Biomphalaria glabrata]|uniref:Uncharacterized protein LOC106078800 isoform X1 n=2 Tax=Biomphalaria glabrata TaxID=6526 RepID=A0A9W3AQQ2_BIOGL|nr:uncharacterized protein LOC106078800 isoform X1 [Biomphalaria glabrata]
MNIQPKRDFGSFHASNVEELLSIDEESYSPPELPFRLPTFTKYKMKETGQIAFGKLMKQTFFLLEENCCFLNHGAFGSVLKQALEVSQQWQNYSESQPLRFYDRQLLPYLVHVSRRLASYIGCAPQDLVLVNNATFATNSVLSSFPLVAEDVILTFNITYGAVKKHVQYICSKSGAINREAVIPFPLDSKEKILDILSDELSKGDVKLVILDHIPSNTPIIMPVVEMIQLCRRVNARVLIDGAHALGALNLNIADIDPDYYVSNCHKWLCSPKGVAFLYVKQELQNEVKPAVISHGFGSGFCSEFFWSGLHDYSPMLSLHTVLDFWLELGESARNYMHQCAKEGAQILTKCWSSKLAAPIEMFGSMVLVGLPEIFNSKFETIKYDAAEKIQNIVFHEYNIEVPFKSVQGHLYVRISAHIYNEPSDYLRLADAVLEISQRPKSFFVDCCSNS